MKELGSKVIKTIILMFVKMIFFIKQRSISKKKRRRLWKQKEEKYYRGLFYWIETKKLIQLLPILLKAEWYQQIRVLPRIVYVISTRCTLKCKYCGEFIPYFQKREDVDSEVVISDLDCLFNNLDYIGVLEFIGGEPFLHSDLDGFLKKVIENDSKIGKIQITTNATVKISEKIIPLLQNEKVEILISKYKVNAVKVREIEKLCKCKGVRCEVINARYWADFGDIRLNNQTKEQTYKMYMKCYASRDCRTMYKGQFLLCSRGPYMVEQVIRPDILNIYIYDFKRELYKFYLRSGYATCRYCLYNEKRIPVAEQIDKV